MVINPATPVGQLENVLDIVDYVLVMSVNPGYGGQKFIPNSLRKVRELVQMREERKLGFVIEIDGGVGMENIADVARAGVDWVVAGSSVFHAPDPAQAVREYSEPPKRRFLSGFSFSMVFNKFLPRFPKKAVPAALSLCCSPRAFTRSMRRPSRRTPSSRTRCFSIRRSAISSAAVMKSRAFAQHLDQHLRNERVSGESQIGGSG